MTSIQLHKPGLVTFYNHPPGQRSGLLVYLWRSTRCECSRMVSDDV